MSTRRDVVTISNIDTDGVARRRLLRLATATATLDIDEVPNRKRSLTKVGNFATSTGGFDRLPIK
jgi:hypothetical protein